MITLFTTTKDFIGINRTNQLNAIRSWLAADCRPEVIVFGKSAGIEELGTHPNLNIVGQVRTTATGAPFAHDMFGKIAEIASHDVCCYLNADILLTSSFFDTVLSLHRRLSSRYLLVGERIDADVTGEMRFSDMWEEEFVSKYGSSFKPHAPYGSDFFVFPKGQYSVGKMSDLLIGRPGWDNWMIWHARKMRYKLVDLSLTVKPYHLNHDYSHLANPHAPDDPETGQNVRDIPENDRNLFVLAACNYFLSGQRILKNYARGDINRSVMIERSLGRYGWFAKFDLRYATLTGKVHLFK